MNKFWLYGYKPVPLFGGNWNNGSNCGSRSSNWNNSPLNLNVNNGCRGSSDTWIKVFLNQTPRLNQYNHVIFMMAKYEKGDWSYLVK